MKREEDWVIEALDVSYTYDGNDERALDGLNLKIRRGTKVAFMGGNGSGKSTFFLCLNGIRRPDTGKIRIDGKAIEYTRKGLLEVRGRVGIVFQEPDDQLFSASVYEEISFGILNLGADEETARSEVESVIEELEITPFQDRPAHALSGGQKKQVAIADILVMHPEVMILDEPTAGLDPQGVSDIMKLLKKLRTELGITIILATHDMDIVPLYCDRVYLLSGGKMVRSGTPEELFAEPEELRQNHLRLPRIAHLMEVLCDRDGVAVDRSAATISAARREILRLIQEEAEQ